MTASVPARVALVEATEANRRLGHENLGFLSESHGFMPVARPRLRLPESHGAWDDAAANLPDLFRTLAVRSTLDRLPVLSAGEDALDDADLLRASVIVSIFAHAYFYADPVPPGPLPASIVAPWAELTRRLDRPAPHLSFTDLNLYNWRLIDDGAGPPGGRIEVENLALLVPILGNEDERRFQMTPIEMLHRFTPIVGAVVRSHEAVFADDPCALRDELMLIADTLRRLALESFAKVDPNPYSPAYVNPVAWGKTVAPIATPFQEKDPPPGPSGTAIPAFQLLDGFIGRRRYATSIGEETARVRRWFPRHWQAFLGAVEEISVAGYVARVDQPDLTGTYRDAVEAYAGDSGLLGRHRLKTYGFLDLSFKAGRTKTLAGFGGGLDDRLWDRMDTELDRARMERYPGASRSFHQARVARLEPEPPAGDEESPWVGHVVLDVAGTGLRYQPGARLAILPENDEDLVDRTLRALRARGDEPVELPPVWQDAVRQRAGYEQASALSLRTLLTFGRIRTVERAAAKTLYVMSDNQTLRKVIEARAEDQWELWELLELLAGAGFTPARLWKALPGEREAICWLVLPEEPRMYSISSAMGAGDDEAGEVRLTLGRLRYRTTETDVSLPGVRLGTASRFLSRAGPATSATRPVPVKVVHPPRFGLPADPTRPVVMIAGGTGLSPFLGMLTRRMSDPDGGENWLFLAARTPADVFGADQLGRWAADGRLSLRTAYSRDPSRPRRHVADEMLDEANAAELWRLLGPAQATFYVCGRSGFATSVTETIRELVFRFSEGSDAERRRQAAQTLFRLVGEGRYLREVFTSYNGPASELPRCYDASDVAVHNDDGSGLWMTIDGRVYDLTEFAHMHPGGPKIMRSYAGMDATVAYRNVRHHLNPEVDALLPMYEIGRVRRLDFGSAWSVCITPGGLRAVPLKEVYRAWIGLLHTTVELENATANDYGVRNEPLTHDEAPGLVRQSRYRTLQLLHTHRRFVDEHLRSVTGERLDQLWRLTSGLASPHLSATWMNDRVAAARASDDAAAATVFERDAQNRLRAGGADVERWCDGCSLGLEAEDRRFLREFKLALRTGVAVFERLQAATAVAGGDELVAAARALPEVIERYFAGVADLAAAVQPKATTP